MWTSLGGLAAIASLFVLIWNLFGILGVAVGLLVGGAIAALLFRIPSAPARKQVDTPPRPTTPAEQAYAPPRPRAPSEQSDVLLPVQEPPASLSEKPGILAPVEGHPIKFPQKEHVKTQRRKEPRFELVPHKMGGMNARIVLSDEIWRQLSKMVISSNGGKCCECPNHQALGLECHEVWAYEWERRAHRPNKIGVMRLVGLRPLCHLCHMVKHIKFAKSQGELPEVTAHLLTLYDGLTEQGLKELIDKAAASSKLKYKYAELDLTYLNDERFAWIHEQIGRKFTANEMPDSDDDEPVRQRPGHTVKKQPVGQPLH